MDEEEYKKKYINLIKQYNEDDLLATKKVKDWLAEEK